MHSSKSNDPLHGLTLKAILETLFNKYGWDGLASRINIRCFSSDPSMKSSLKFLRKTDWARAEVEQLFVKDKTAEKNKEAGFVWKTK